MSLNSYNPTTGKLTRIAGGTLYADAPVGSIQAFGGSSAPSGWLICKGQAVSRTTYAELFAVIGTAYGSGDGSTTFNIPDLREATTKGVGLSGKSDNHYDVDGIALGEFVEDRIQNHQHAVYKNYEVGATGGAGTTTNYGGEVLSGNASGRIGDTTEVKAVGVNYIIKAKQIAVPADIAAGIDTSIANAITEALAIKTITPTIEAAGTSVTCVRSGKAVMVHVHSDTVSVSFNSRVNLASGLPKPASGIIPTGLNDWGGIDTHVNVELSVSGTLMAVGATGTSSTNVTVDSTFTYITSE